MKYSLTAFFALLLSATLIGACSQEETMTIENPPADLTEAGADDTDTEDSDDEDAEETDDEDESEEDGSDSDNEDDKDAKDKDSKSDTEGIEQKNVKLEVSNQQSYGQIKVRKVATSRDGWVSVHKSKEDGTIFLPDSIGEARVDSGDSEDIIVDLWESPDVGDKLWVLLHVDSGERGKYEFPEKDAPVKRNGETMARSLVIQGEKEDKEDEDE